MYLLQAERNIFWVYTEAIYLQFYSSARLAAGQKNIFGGQKEKEMNPLEMTWGLTLSIKICFSV